MKKLLAIVLVLVFAMMMAVPAFASTDDAFDKIFADHGIVRIPAMYPLLDYYAYAYATPDGVVDCMEYGVDGNVICEWVENLYFPIADATEEDRAIMEYNLMMNFTALDAEDFCVVNSYQMGSHINISIRFTDLEYKEVITRMKELGLLDPNAEYLGIRLAEQNLLAQGYVKDY